MQNVLIRNVKSLFTLMSTKFDRTLKDTFAIVVSIKGTG